MARYLTVIAQRSPGTILLGQFASAMPLELRILDGSDVPALSQRHAPTSMSKLVVQRATELSDHYKLPAVADVWGLEVAALGGRPGVRSAHFAHHHATDAENNAALLRSLEKAESADRSAVYRHIFALVSPWRDGATIGEASCTGTIALAAGGSGGLGYEQLLMVQQEPPKVLAELDGSEVARVNPRVRAARQTADLLGALIDEQLAAVSKSLGQ